jgi:hypothetical protein
MKRTTKNGTEMIVQLLFRSLKRITKIIQIKSIPI